MTATKDLIDELVERLCEVLETAQPEDVSWETAERLESVLKLWRERFDAAAELCA